LKVRNNIIKETLCPNGQPRIAGRPNKKTDSPREGVDHSGDGSDICSRRDALSWRAEKEEADGERVLGILLRKMFVGVDKNLFLGGRYRTCSCFSPQPHAAAAAVCSRPPCATARVRTVPSPCTVGSERESVVD
jgi:hypothetical protein